MDTLTQVERLIELAIIQRSELRRLVEELPQLKAHLSEEIERTFEETEPQLRAELEEWTTKQTADKTAALGVALEAKIADLAKSLEVSTQARYNAIIAERAENARLAAQAEAKIAEHAASLPGAVKEIVSAELARFPRAGEIDQLRKEFAEPKSLNPRGKWVAGETYNKLDLVTINGDSYVSNIDGNTEKPSRSAANWTLNAARGNSGGGGGITALNDLLGNPSAGDIVGSEGNNYVRKTLTAGTGITITDDPSTITIDATGAQETLTATVKNAESVAITRGQVVYLFSATGGFPSVKLAYNTSDATSAKTFGVVSDVSIAPNGTGTITCVGVVSNLNLGAYNDGDTVYLGDTPGSFTATKPYAPNHLVYVGIIERANAGNGELYVRVQNGYELDEIHDVQINNPRQAGQTLIYDATNALWKNARLTAGVGVSITNADSSITISADGGVNYQGTWNASTNTPTLTSSVGTKGFYYVVSVAGSTNLNGVTDWKVGDWAIFNGTAWEKVDTTDQVSSVFGRTGAVVGVSTDYSSVGITNTAIGATNPSTGAFTTLTASSTTDSSSKDTGAIVTEGGLGVEKSATIGGNLTVSGNAAIGTDVFKIDSTNTRILFGLAAALQGDTVEIAAKSNAGAISLFGRASNNQSVISFRQNGSPTQKAFVQGGDTGLELGAGSSIGLTINSSNNTTLAGNLTVSGTGTSTFSGQISSTSAATASGDLRLNHSAGGKVIRWASANYNVDLYQSGDNDILRTRVANFAISSDPTFASNFTTIAAGNITTSGNLTVSGTGASSFAGRLSISSTTGVGLQTALAVSSSSGLGVFTDYTKTSGTSRTWSLGATGSSSSAGDNAFALYDGTAAAFRFLVTSGGNYLIGTTIDGGQKLQVSGTGYLSDSLRVGTSWSPLAWGVKAIEVNDAGGGLFAAYYNGTAKGYIIANSGDFAINTQGANSLLLRTNGNTALTLDSSQNAIFAGSTGVQLKNDSFLYFGSTVRTAVKGNSTGSLELYANNNLSLTLDSSANATFAGTDVTVNGGSTSSTLTLKRASNSYGAVVSYNTTTTNKWFHGLRGLTNDNWYLYNNVAGNNALIFDAATSNATFAGTVTSSIAGAGAGFRIQRTGASASLGTILNSGGEIIHDYDSFGYSFRISAVEKFNINATRALFTGKINAANLPTSASGLSAGDIWNDGGTLKIV